MEATDQKLHARLRRFITRLVRRPEDVDDVMQESFLKLLEAGSKGEIKYRQAYLYRTARNLVINQANSKAHRLVESVADFDDLGVLLQTETLEHDFETQQRLQHFCQAAAGLPEQCRRVLVLRKVYGYSQEEVAKKMAISISTVEKHLAKALVRCRQYLTAHGQLPEPKRRKRRQDEKDRTISR